MPARIPESFHPVTQALIGLLMSVLLVRFIGIFTNTIAPAWDGIIYYVMAQYGVINNPHLVAPFAYRPAVPIMVRLLSMYLKIKCVDLFGIFAQMSAITFVLFTFLFAKRYGAGFINSLIIMLVVAFSFYHVKFPIFLYSMVDVETYPIMLLSMWALLRKKLALCVAISCVGLFFKEFLVIPAIIAIVSWYMIYKRSHSRKYLLWIILAWIGIMASIAIPRYLIPVRASIQFIDLTNEPGSLKFLIQCPLDIKREFNIFFSVMAYWLPTILLLTRSRLKHLWDELDEHRLMLFLYLALIFILTMYGGSNIPIFISYSFFAQLIVLSILLKYDVNRAEIAYMLVAVFFFNRILWHIPPGMSDLENYLDFYGGYFSRVNASSLNRLMELAAFIVLGNILRVPVFGSLKWKQSEYQP